LDNTGGRDGRLPTQLLLVGGIEFLLVCSLWNRWLWVSVLHFTFGYSATSDNVLSWEVEGGKSIQLLGLTLESAIAHRHAGCFPICELIEIKQVLRCQEVYISENKAEISSIADQVQTQKANKDG
jgi:hypothetical protein